MSQRSPSTLWSLPLLNLVFGLGLCIIHAHAETIDPAVDGDSMGAWDRITSGPIHWSAMDKVLFFALIMLALEILNFLCNNSGGTKEYAELVFAMWILKEFEALFSSAFSLFINTATQIG